MSDPKPLRGSAKKARRKKNAGVKDKTYLAWLHGQGCIVRGCKAPVEAHHERTISRDDAWCVTLCKAHHRGEHGRHGLQSLQRFEEAYALSVRTCALHLRGKYLAEKGESHGTSQAQLR